MLTVKHYKDHSLTGLLFWWQMILSITWTTAMIWKSCKKELFVSFYILDYLIPMTFHRNVSSIYDLGGHIYDLTHKSDYKAAILGVCMSHGVWSERLHLSGWYGRTYETLMGSMTAKYLWGTDGKYGSQIPMGHWWEVQQPNMGYWWELRQLNTYGALMGSMGAKAILVDIEWSARLLREIDLLRINTDLLPRQDTLDVSNGYIHI